jgi:hypothetical protein
MEKVKLDPDCRIVKGNIERRFAARRASPLTADAVGRH